MAADWRRAAYAMPLGIACLLVLLGAVRVLLHITGLLLHPTGLFAGTGPLATLAVLYLILLDIPGRKLSLGRDAVTIRSWLRTRTIAWTDITEVLPGTSGLMNVNRQLPAAVRLVVRGTAETVRIPNVFRLKRQELYARVREHWLAARSKAIDVTPHPTTPGRAV